MTREPYICAQYVYICVVSIDNKAFSIYNSHCAKACNKGDFKLSKEVVVTYQGLQALETEVEQLKTVRRKEVSEKIKIARSFGDLSENSEYDEAKNEQAFVESRILELEAILKNVRVIDEDEISGDRVSVGTVVKIKDEKGQEASYDIVGSTEADPFQQRISDESPIGSALLSHKVGDKVEVKLPNGNVVYYTVLEIGKQNL